MKVNMTEVIAILALITSVFILIIQYRNQIEQRNGEISRLRAEILQRINNTHHRMMSIRMHLELARLELRRVQDSDDKYNAIERIPKLIEEIQITIDQLLDIKKVFEDLNVSKMNRSAVLMKIQSLKHEFDTVEIHSNETEKATLDFFKLIIAEN